MKKAILHLMALVAFHQSGFGQDKGKLTVGNKVLKTIGLKEKHNYSIDLKKGQFALLNIEQKKMDVKIVTYDPDGRQIEEFDSDNGNNGDELVLIDGKITGSYRLEVMPLGETKKIKKGAYTIVFNSKSDTVEAHLDSVLDLLNNRGFLPGYAATIVDADTMLYKRAWGYANVDNKMPYTVETVQNIASISKTFIGISLMMMVEEGKLTLDTHINDILPFDIVNPYFPNRPITIRHLATHTGTINDFPYYYERAGVLLEQPPLELSKYPNHIRKTLKMAKANKDMTMVDFIKKMLTKEGEWYRKKNFFKRPPGQEWYYSNVGAALAAHIVELTSGVAYDDFVKNRILKPLKLHSAGWNEDEIEVSKLASNYTQGPLLLPSYKVITYPDGQIYIDSNDLGRYLMSLIKGFKGTDGLLKASSYQELMKVQHEQATGDFKGRKDGIFWEFSKTGVMGHSGGDTGVSAFMYFNPQTTLGYTYMTNILPAESDDANVQSRKIWSTVKRYAIYLKRP